jgi:hypothetical protein
MEPLVLTDKNIFPDQQVIASHIGIHMQQWDNLLQSVRISFPGAEEKWNYYNDGKSWLFRIIWKKKTLFWVGIIKGTFRVTFYFGEKARALVESAPIPEDLKNQYRDGKWFGKLKAVTIYIKGDPDIADVLTIAGIKAKIK